MPTEYRFYGIGTNASYLNRRGEPVKPLTAVFRIGVGKRQTLEQIPLTEKDLLSIIASATGVLEELRYRREGSDGA